MEFYELYDKYGNNLHKVVNHDYALSNNEYRAIAHLVIFNEKKEMLIQKRGIYKKDFPNVFDISCGGGVNEGESAYQAAKRELKEELGISLDFDDRAYFRVFYPKGIDDYFIAIVNKDDINPIIDYKEVLAFRWASEKEIVKMMKKKQFVSYNKGFIELLFAMINNRGTYLL